MKDTLQRIIKRDLRAMKRQRRAREATKRLWTEVNCPDAVVINDFDLGLGEIDGGGE